MVFTTAWASVRPSSSRHDRSTAIDLSSKNAGAAIVDSSLDYVENHLDTAQLRLVMTPSDRLPAVRPNVFPIRHPNRRSRRGQV